MDENRTRPADGPQSLGDVVSRLVALRGYGQHGAQGQLAELWCQAAGSAVARQTRVIGLRNGTLLIGVRNAALLSELAAFHKRELLQRVQEKCDGATVHALKFRLRSDISGNE